MPHLPILLWELRCLAGLIAQEALQSFLRFALPTESCNRTTDCQSNDLFTRPRMLCVLELGSGPKGHHIQSLVRILSVQTAMHLSTAKCNSSFTLHLEAVSKSEPERWHGCAGTVPQTAPSGSLLTCSHYTCGKFKTEAVKLLHEHQTQVSSGACHCPTS